MTYLVRGLDPAPFRQFAAMDDAELVRHSAVRVAVDAKPGYPCRITLEDAEPGEAMILLNHCSREGDTPYGARHAIFVGENALRVGEYFDRTPPVFAGRHLSLRAFDLDGMMVDALLAAPGEADDGLRRLFGNERVLEVDVHNAVRGCFAARALRA